MLDPLNGAVTSPAKYTLEEKHLLMLIAAGYTNERIARTKNVHIDTAKNHVHQVTVKLGARNRANAVALAVKFGVLKL